jgi:carboxyl-terminal processing protease
MKTPPYRQPGFIVSTFVLAVLISFQVSDRAPLAAGADSIDSALKEMQVFVEAYRIVQSDYADTTKLAPSSLIAGAIRGMLATLGDPHTRYLPLQEARELMMHTEGEFGGIGIHIGVEKDRLTVIAPVEGTPAWRGGVEAGDVIVKIDDLAADTMGLDQAVALLRGQVGTSVTIEVERYGFDEPIAIKLVREVIRVQSVRQTSIDNLGYIRISQFSELTAEELDAALKTLSAQRVRGLILDLRDNPGGVLDGAVAVGNRFIESGVIVSTISRDPRQSRVYYASPASTVTHLPVVVLVNGNSASASEIVSGAIQDLRRGVVIGTKTYGKGSVQTVENLPDGSKIALTTARYFTPSGRSIHGTGIDPDTGMVVEIAELSDSDIVELRKLNETDVIRNFTRGREDYTPDELTELEAQVRAAGVTLSRETLERRLVVELARRNDHRTYLVPHLDPQLRKAISVLKAAIRVEPVTTRR